MCKYVKKEWEGQENEGNQNGAVQSKNNSYVGLSVLPSKMRCKLMPDNRTEVPTPGIDGALKVFLGSSR